MDSRNRILAAATEVFVEKGLTGARMQEIADRARVNKAMLHYYFTSKEHLYENVIVAAIADLMRQMRGTLADENVSFADRLYRFVSAYFDVIVEHPYLPRLIAQDLMTAEARVVRYFQRAAEQTGILRPFPFLKFIEEGIERGALRRIDAKQACVSLISMIVFYFIGQPILSAMLDLDDEDNERFIVERKRHVVDLFLRGMLMRENGGDVLT